MKLRVACIQNNPIIGKVEQNIERIRSLLGYIDDVDIVVLPELAITGYNFSSREEITPYLELVNQGRSTKLAREILNKFNCFTLIGYPERECADAQTRIFNSAVLTSPVGKVLCNYRKTHLYETDEVFGCTENPNKRFEPVELILDKDYYIKGEVADRHYPKVLVNIGICMDLNPYKFEAPFNRYEFSLLCYRNMARLILCPMAWLSPDSPSLSSQADKVQEKKFRELINSWDNATPLLNLAPSPTDNYSKKQAEQQKDPEHEYNTEEPSYSTINYWILRFFPFLNHDYNNLQRYYERAYVVTCNRTGIEGDVLFGGSSSIIEFKNNIPGNSEIDNTNPSVEVKGSLGQGKEGVLLREIDVDCI